MQTHADQSASILAGSVSSCAVSALSEEDGGLAVINLLLELWPCLASSEPQPTSAFTLAASTWQQLRSFAAAHGWQTLYAAFLRQQYSSWAAAVLAATEEASKQQVAAAGAPPPPAAAAASGRHSRGSSMQAAAAATLRQAPASTALAALTEHLATVQPLAFNSHSQPAASASLAPPSAQLALSLLAERFAAPGSPGVLQVLLQCLPPAAFHKAAPAAAASTGIMKAATPEGPESAAVTAVESIHGTPTSAAAAAAACAELQGYHLQLSASEAADAAAVLASVPDRVQHLSGGLRDLQQPQYACTVLLQALTGLQWVLETVKQQQADERSESSGSNGNGSNSTSSSSSRRKDGISGECDVAVSFVVELVHRCIRRGQAAAVAAVLWRLTAPDAPVLQIPVHGVNGHPCAATPGAAAAAGGGGGGGAGGDVAAQAAAAAGGGGGGGGGGGRDAAAAAAAAAGDEGYTSAVQAVGTVLRPSVPLLAAASPHGRSGVVVVADSTLMLVLQGLSQHGASLERLLGQLLVLAGAPAASGTMVTNTATTSSSSSRRRRTMDASTTEGSATSSPNSSSSSSHPGVMERLTRLLHPLLTRRGAADYLISERLLLQRTLPLAALYCLVRLLYSCALVMLVKAGQRLADSWGDAHTIATTKVAQQAFMTAALVAVLQQLPGRCLDPAVASDAGDAGDAGDTMDIRCSTQQHLQSTLVAEAAGLVPAILSGVSTRLGNPLPALRRQGMRVGQALAAQLDPGKHTQLFGDQDLGLQPEEVWPGMSLTKLPPGLAAAEAAVEAAVGPSSHATGSSREGAAGSQPAGSSKQGVALNPAAGSSSSSSSTVSEGVSHPQQLGGQQAGPPVHGKDLTSGRDSALAKVLEEAEEPDSDDAEDGQPWSNVDQVNGTAAGPLSQSKLPPVAVPVGAGGGGGGADSDSGSEWGEDWGEDAAVEDPAAEEWWAADGLGLPEGKPLSLRALAAALRKQDDVNAVLDAVGRAEVLIRAAPDELAAHGPELARALLHCRVPEWADAEAPTPEAQPARQRGRALTALLVAAPGPAGDQVLSEVYSQHLDQYQRLLILDSLSAAAQELADERSAPQLLAAPGAAPQLLPPAAKGATNSRALPATAAAAAAGEGAANSQDGTSSPSSSGGARAAPGLRQVTTRVWGPVSLAKQREPGHKTFKNRFGPFALRWATALLKDCDRPSPGIDLFGPRDALLLGRLLSVLSTFAAAAADTPAALPLAAGVLELLRAPAVHGHPQVFVRRNALAAAAQVLSHLPAPRVAAALLGHQRDAGDTLLQERLTWLQEWAAGVAAADSDEPCRMLAAGCCALQGQLAEEALKSMEQLPEALPGLGSGQRLGGGVQVQVPSLSGLRLG